MQKQYTQTIPHFNVETQDWQELKSETSKRKIHIMEQEAKSTVVRMTSGAREETQCLSTGRETQTAESMDNLREDGGFF